MNLVNYVVDDNAVYLEEAASNTGLPGTTKSALSYCCDWVSGSSVCFNEFDVFRAFHENITEQILQAFVSVEVGEFKVAYQTFFKRVTFMGALPIYTDRLKKSGEVDSKYIYFSWSGGQCQKLQTFVDDISLFLIRLYQNGVKFTRIDGAIDDCYSPIFSLRTLANKAKKGEYKSCFRSVPEIIHGSGLTVYMGSKGSECFIRFYDKRAEQVPKLLGYFENIDWNSIPQWQRYEIEVRNAYCREFMNDLIELQDLGLVIKSWIASKVTFLTPSKTDSNKKRWKTWKPWADFTEGSFLVKGAPGRANTDFVDNIRWFQDSVADSLLVFAWFKSKGIEFFSDMPIGDFGKGPKKINEKRFEDVKEYVALNHYELLSAFLEDFEAR